MTQSTLKQLKKIYETSIKPLENAYKYKVLSNRHLGDPEIFTKPLVVLMGPWSGGKSTMVNYILGNEYNKNAFKTGKKYNYPVHYMSINQFLNKNNKQNANITVLITKKPNF